MKILILGFLVFSGWSALSSYIYVCKIKGLCYEPVNVPIGTNISNDISPVDSLQRVLIPEQAATPKNMLIYFSFDNSEFNSDAKSDNYCVAANTYLNQNSLARLSIIGHTDATGSDEYNQALGYRRAQSIQNYFESKGMPVNKILIDSRGESEPADENITTTGRANNRRTSIIVKK